MALPDFEVVDNYVGNGVTTAFTFDFKIKELEHLLVVTATAANVVTHSVRGDDITFLSNVDFDPDNGGGTVHLLAPLTSGHKLLLLLANDEPVQLSAFRNKSDFTLKRIEDALDYQMGAVQRIAYLAQRSIKQSDLDGPGFDMTMPAGLVGAADLVPLTNVDGTGFAPPDQWLSGADLRAAAALGSGGAGVLDIPTDGKFGTPGAGVNGTAGSISGVEIDDRVADAFDKVEVILEKLAPARPPNLSATVLQITGSYTAKEATTGTTRTVVTDDDTPTIQTATAFGDGATGTLTGTIDATPAGSITLSAASDVGTNGDLQVTSDVDFYAGVSGKENFWFVLQARINRSISLATGTHTAGLTHSITGTASLGFSVDNPATPSIAASGRTVVGSGTAGTISGVPAIITGGTITAGFTVDNAVKSHYNSTRIASAQLPGGTVISAALPVTPPAPNDSVAASIPMTVTNQYSENIAVAVLGYNSKSVTAGASLTGNVRVDALSSEANRYKSGTGQYPTQGAGPSQFGDTWVSSTSLATNEELQMLSGLYQYPPAVNYTTNLPTAGPNYSALSAGSYANMRWVTFKLSAALSNASSVTFTLNGAVNMGATPLVSGLALYVRVVGALPTTGWVDANAAYPGVGNPTASGDPALDVAQSTATVKRVTFGASVKTGDVWVRVGIPSGSTKKLSGVS